GRQQKWAVQGLGAPGRSCIRAAPDPSAPAAGTITSAAIDDEASNSGWNVVGPSKESRARVAGGAGGAAGQAAASRRALAVSAGKTEIGFEMTHGTSQPGSRASTR